MIIPYRTRRLLQKLGAVALILVIVLMLGWLCWVVWLERYVVYTRSGAVINFQQEQLSVGSLASPPTYENSVEIYYNEGSNTMDISQDLTQITGYYIQKSDLADNLPTCREKLSTLAAGTALMVDLKNADGTFNYSSDLMEASTNSTLDIPAVESFIADMNTGKFYTIARIPAFRDYLYGLNHTSCGLSHASWGQGYLWTDEDNCYWLDPTNSQALNWIISIIEEVKKMGFNEIVLDDFRIPTSEKILFKQDRTEALQKAMNTILETCGSDGFTISFVVSDATFALPDGHSRLYLKNITADQVGAKAAQVTITDPENRLVFLAETNDTRYDAYSVLRPIASSDVLEDMQ